jgi:hypothetical protein
MTLDPKNPEVDPKKPKVPYRWRWLDPWDTGEPDLLNTVEMAYIPLREEEYKAEQELAEKYRSFVSEVSVAGRNGRDRLPSGENPFIQLDRSDYRSECGNWHGSIWVECFVFTSISFRCLRGLALVYCRVAL